jgi:prepilin-type N-terminal cleavage/methylation domain-containing protein/prepilin-type processing-associated H-X9-DG protein
MANFMRVELSGLGVKVQAGNRTDMNEHRIIERRGFTLIEFLLVIAMLAVLIALYLPSMARRHARSSRLNCVNNLKQVGLAFRQWGLDNDDKFPMQVSVTNGGTMELINSGNVFVHFLVMSNELNTPRILLCPEESNHKRQTATTFASSVSPGVPYQVPFTNDNNVSYFVGADAAETSPQMFLTGDDNMTVLGVRVTRGILSLWTNTPVAWTKDRHVNQGNICLADGSVQGLNSQLLKRAFQSTGVITNRIAFP